MAARLILATLLLTGPAMAEGPIAEVICGSRSEMVARLEGQYRAQVTAMGVRDRETVMEVWADERGRWTLVQRYANGKSCILAMGADWMALENPA